MGILIEAVENGFMIMDIKTDKVYVASSLYELEKLMVILFPEAKRI